MLLQSTQPEETTRIETAMNLVQTVQENYEGYTKREVLKAKEARQEQAMIGNPSEGDYRGLVNSNMISNCLIAPTNITNACAIFGPDLASVWRKTVCWTPALVVADHVAVPPAVVERNKVVMMAADVFFVDGLPFLVTLSRNIKFVMVEHLPVRTANTLVKHIEWVLHVYSHGGFNLRTMITDGEFEKIKGLLRNVECNTTAVKEHVSKAEQMIHTIKERTRGSLATLPFEHIPWRMKIKFIYFIVLWLNAFLVKSRISSTFSPCKLLVRWKLEYKKHCQVLPGMYCEVHLKPSPSNTMTPCTHEAIALGPTGNLQGSVKFYFLDIGWVLKRCSFMPFPMPDRISAKVNNIGAKEKQGRTFRFLNQQVQPYEWTDEVSEDNAEFQGLLEEKEAVPYPDLSAEPPGVELEREEAKFTAITKEDEPDFRALAAAALGNAGIDPDMRIRAANNYIDNNAEQQGPAFIEANQDKIVYEITFDLPDSDLAPGQNTIPAGADEFGSNTHSSIK
jgi:hypothetical protein